MTEEIKVLFDRLDTGKNGWLTAQELLIVLKNDRQQDNLSLEKARQIIDQIDKDSNGKISKDEFVRYVL